MKKILTIALLFIFIGCGKDGSIGPQGEQGVQGIRGEKGEDGTTIYSGTVVPPANLGSEGDFYFRTGTSDFYGPKTDAGWGIPTNLKGATGARGATGAPGPAGTAGSKILSGTAVPAANTGANGDFYFRTSTADFYGPKVSSGWGTPINFKGVKGEDGSRIYSGTSVPATNLGNDGDFYFRTSTSDFYGPKTGTGWGTPTNLKGATGAPGAPGAAGAAGSKILSGTVVPAANTGANGDFYFRTSTADFYGPKSSSGWGTPINLKGVKGEDGSRIYSGTNVPATSLGTDGDFYFRTSTSDFYGPKTGTGWGTPTNLKGATGAPGSAGSKILSGTAIPTASTGVNGDFYLRTTTADFYGPKTSSGWGTPINLRGTQGPAGPQGPPGTANVIYSNWFAMSHPDDWEYITSKHIRTIFYVGELVANPNSLVMVYIRTPGSIHVRPLPIYNFNTGSRILSYEFSYHDDLPLITIDIKSSTVDFGQPNIYDAFRYVIIPGGVSTTAMSGHRNTERSVEFKGKIYTKTDLENMSYAEVSKLVGIDD